MNPLEEALVAAQAGEMDSVAFMERLVASHVHILVNQEFADSRDPAGVKPLILEGGSGEPLLALFTAAARGMPMTQDNPEFPFSVEVSFAWAVGSTDEGMGLVINPGWDTGVTIPPEAISAMKR
ncbi:MAG: SseB family protein [Ectothiorhodospiraceae bacterium]|nr:SseB family protein [Ectothiorhodospiraceae bacterium]MCH8505776.1 SseB family protein [Ectothiorhodospiraceae bacterium]